MNRFVANLLDMTRLEAGALKARLIVGDISEVVIDATGHLSRVAAQKGVALAFRRHPVAVKMDPVLLERALLNVLENAIDFSPAGGTVSVAIQQNERGASIAVSDEGPGIAPGDLPHVFEKFYRSSESASGRRGVGLGLSIAKGLIEALGGIVVAESPISQGRGAKFTIQLMRAAAQ